MRTKVVKKSILPFIALLLGLALTIPASAAAICGICGEYGSVYCTGNVISHEITHYQHQYGFIHWGWECKYTTPRHDVRTTCCNASWGGHVYREYTHPVCGLVEEEFPCSQVPNWVMDP